MPDGGPEKAEASRDRDSPRGDALRVLQQIDTTFRDQIRHADQKASIVLAFVVGLFTVNRDAVGLARDMVTGQRASLAAGLTLAFFAVLCLSMATAFGAIVPRFNQRVRTILYWEAWRGPPEVALKLERRLQEAGFARAEFVRDIQVLADIIARKLFWLRCAIVGLYASLLLFGTLAILKALP